MSCISLLKVTSLFPCTSSRLREWSLLLGISVDQLPFIGLVSKTQRSPLFISWDGSKPKSSTSEISMAIQLCTSLSRVQNNWRVEDHWEHSLPEELLVRSLTKTARDQWTSSKLSLTRSSRWNWEPTCSKRATATASCLKTVSRRQRSQPSCQLHSWCSSTWYLSFRSSSSFQVSIKLLTF